MCDEVGTSFGSSMLKLGMIVMMENPRAISEKCTRPCVKLLGGLCLAVMRRRNLET